MDNSPNEASPREPPLHAGKELPHAGQSKLFPHHRPAPSLTCNPISAGTRCGMGRCGSSCRRNGKPAFRNGKKFMRIAPQQAVPDFVSGQEKAYGKAGCRSETARYRSFLYRTRAGKRPRKDWHAGTPERYWRSGNGLVNIRRSGEDDGAYRLPPFSCYSRLSGTP